MVGEKNSWKETHALSIDQAGLDQKRPPLLKGATERMGLTNLEKVHIYIYKFYTDIGTYLTFLPQALGALTVTVIDPA